MPTPLTPAPEAVATTLAAPTAAPVVTAAPTAAPVVTAASTAASSMTACSTTASATTGARAAIAPATGLPPLSPTPRTTVGRGGNRVVADRAALHALLDDALVAHLGVVVGDGHPLVLPVAFGVDLDGPDDGGSLYVHGSVAARWLRGAADATVCVTVTELDGLVAGRSAFHHSMNYRSAVVIGRARVVEDAAERQHALNLIVDHMIPGRAATLRASTRKELAATALLAVPLHEASMKERAGGPGDEPEDCAAGGWGGHIPLRRTAGDPVPDLESAGEPPAEVQARARHLTTP